MHAVGPEHDTPTRLLETLPGLGLGETDHVVPFHSSVNVCVEPVASPDSPTATQYAWVTHDTPRNLFSGLPVFGLGTTVQVLPSQISTSVWPVQTEFTCPGPELPTATQKVELTQETPASSLVGLALGAGAIVHTAPSQASIRACRAPSVACV
jgi:hypothetical protein